MWLVRGLFKTKQLDRVISKQSFTAVLQSQFLDLPQAFFPGKSICAPETPLLTKPAVDELNDLRREVFRHPGIDAKPNVIPLVTNGYQLIDPGPAGMCADQFQPREIAGHAVQIDGPAAFAWHSLEYVAHLQRNGNVQFLALRI